MAQQGGFAVQAIERYDARRLTITVTTALALVNLCAFALAADAYVENRRGLNHVLKAWSERPKFHSKGGLVQLAPPPPISEVVPWRWAPGLMALLLLAITVAVMSPFRKALHWSLLALSLVIPVVNVVIGIAIWRMHY